MKRLLFALAAAAALVLPAGALAHGRGHGDRHGRGNSWAAHACRHGGFRSLVGADGTTFRNTGACVRFAAHGGTFAAPGSASARSTANGFEIPAGAVATISNARWTLDPCDALTYGYQIDQNVPVTLASKPGGACATGSLPGATIGPFSTAVVLRIFLTDSGDPAIPVSCSDIFYSNGSHALISGGNPWQVDIRDSSACAVGPNTPLVPAGPGQGNVDLTITVSNGLTQSSRQQGGGDEHGNGRHHGRRDGDRDD